MLKGNEKGFTLLELLVAMSVLSIGILGVATMMATGIGTGRFAHVVAVESSIASSVLEEMMARDGNDTVFSTNVTGAIYDLDASSVDTGRMVQGRRYTATYSINTNNPVTGVAKIDVVVSGGGRTTRYSSLKSVL